jgi:NAD+ diphosphatase
MPPEPYFSGPGLDRADPLRARPAELSALATQSEARSLAWHDGAPAIGANGLLMWTAASGDEPLFLGFDRARRPCFSRLPEGPAAADARAHFALLGALDELDAPLFAAALSLANWHCKHGFCACCGNPTVPSRGGWSRACASCGGEHYPRVDPVVIMLATHDGRVLLGRQPQYPPRRYSALAGFVEPGETIEAAVARELFEESGIRVGAVRYAASQPWPFPSSLMIGAHAEALGDELVIDHDELDDARWFSRAEVAAAIAGERDATFLPPPRFAIARTLLDDWLGALEVQPGGP